MPGLTGPLFSLSASGTLANAITYSRWKGVKYARQRVVPANPRSTSQVFNRTAFAALNAMFGYLPEVALHTWQLAANNRPVTDRNVFIQRNAFNLEDQDDYTLLELFGARGEMPIPTTVVATDAGGQDLNITWPNTLPAMDGNIFAIAAAIKEGDHSTPPPYEIFFASSQANPTNLTLSLGTSGTYHWAAAFVLSPNLVTDPLILVSRSVLGDTTIA